MLVVRSEEKLWSIFHMEYFAFSSPPLGSLGTTYDVSLGLIGKHVVDCLLVLIELFC